MREMYVECMWRNHDLDIVFPSREAPGFLEAAHAMIRKDPKSTWSISVRGTDIGWATILVTKKSGTRIIASSEGEQPIEVAGLDTVKAIPRIVAVFEDIDMVLVKQGIFLTVLHRNEANVVYGVDRPALIVLYDHLPKQLYRRYCDAFGGFESPALGR